MSLRVVNKETLINEKVLSKNTQQFELHPYGSNLNLDAVNQKAILKNSVIMTGPKWENSAGYNTLWDEIGVARKRIQTAMNAAQPPNQELINQFVAKIFIDLTRRQMEEPDLTGEFATEVTNPDFQRKIFLSSLLPYVGEMQEISATGDPVPLMEQNLGLEDALYLNVFGMGFTTSLANILWNPLHDAQRVTQAAASANIDMRNSRTVGKIVAATYHAKQKVAASTTGSSYDEKMYNTLVTAVEKLQALKDVHGKPINASKMSLLINSHNRWALERVISGQLQSSSTTGLTTNAVSGIPISSLVEYNEGITHGMKRGSKTLSYPGVEPGKAYLFVPKEAFWVANKRGLTLETGVGSVLELAQRESAWYRVQGEFSKHFFGASAPGAAAVTTANPATGYVVEVTLPVK